MEAILQKRYTEIIREHEAIEENKQCADCMLPAMHFIDMNNIVFLCQRCAEFHINCGFRVKTTTVTEFTKEEMDEICNTNNKIQNTRFLGDFLSKKRHMKFTGKNQAIQFINDKYVKRSWYKEVMTPKKNVIAVRRMSGQFGKDMKCYSPTRKRGISVSLPKPPVIRESFESILSQESKPKESHNFTIDELDDDSHGSETQENSSLTDFLL